MVLNTSGRRNLIELIVAKCGVLGTAMGDVDKDHIIDQLISSIKREFPDVGLFIERQMKSLGLEPEDKMYAQMFECFSQSTTDAIKKKDSDTASKHLVYMSNKLKYASDIEREYIDVYYVEPLMWDIKERNIKSWGWKLFPRNIKALYEAMWGKQSL